MYQIAIQTAICATFYVTQVTMCTLLVKYPSYSMMYDQTLL